MIVVTDSVNIKNFLQWAVEAGLTVIDKPGLEQHWVPAIVPGYDIAYKCGGKYYDTETREVRNDFYVRVISAEAKALVKLTFNFTKSAGSHPNGDPIYYLFLRDQV